MPKRSPDGKYIAFISTRSGSAQVWLLSSDFGEAKQFTTYETGVQNFSWIPHENMIVFTAVVPRNDTGGKSAVKDSKAKVWGEQGGDVHLFSQKLGDKSAARITDGDFSIYDFSVSQRGEIACLAAPGLELEDWQYASVRIVSITGEPVRAIDIPQAMWWGISWSPDCRNLALISADYGKKIASLNLFLLSADGGNIRNVTKDFEPDIMEGSLKSYQWIDNEHIVCSVIEGVRGPLYKIRVTDGSAEKFCDGDFVTGELSYNRVHGKLAFLKTDPTHPFDVYVTSIDRYQPKKLSDANPQLQNFNLGRIEAVTWKGADNWDIEGVLIKPRELPEGQLYPLITHVHGGPAYAFKLNFDPFWHLCANRGYVVLAPNPRGSFGYGEDFVAANYRDYGGNDYKDIMKGVDFLIKEDNADPDRLGIFGHSYGGYMTAWTVTQTDRFSAAVMSSGISDWGSHYGEGDVQWLSKDCDFGAVPWEDPEIYRKCSPINYVDRVATPLLILHGLQDTRISYMQAKRYYVALRDRGMPVKFVTYPGEGHNVRSVPHRIDYYGRILDWFSKYLSGK